MIASRQYVLATPNMSNRLLADLAGPVKGWLMVLNVYNFRQSTLPALWVADEVHRLLSSDMTNSHNSAAIHQVLTGDVPCAGQIA